MNWIVDNLIAWSEQLCVLIAVAAIASRFLKHPKARLIFWQSTVAIALMLPMIQPWTIAQPDAAGVSVSTRIVAIATLPPSHGWLLFWRSEYLLLLLAAGVALRLIWIVAGFARLRSYRLQANAVASPVSSRGSMARWYVSSDISGPITFGWLNPSILLPARVLDLPHEMQEAIACHELLHVERGDWLFVIAEEMIRSALWFHPGIWFALNQIQLAREQTVDREAIHRIRSREHYLDALVAVAEQSMRPALLFLKKRQLAARVAQILKETRMSKSNLVARVATVSTAAAIAVRLAVWFFPMQSQAQHLPDVQASIVADGRGVTVDSGGRILHRPPLFQPVGTSAGTVIVEATLNAKGEVADAKVLNGPDELRRATIQSVLQWHYLPDTPHSVQISIQFASASFSHVAEQVGGPSLTGRVKSISFGGVSPELEQKVRDALPIREGDRFSNVDLRRIRKAVNQIDEHLLVNAQTVDPSQSEGARDINLRISLLLPAVDAPIPAAVREAPKPATLARILLPDAVQAFQPQRIRVGGNVQQANLITKVTPPYPAEAKQARVQGAVRLTVIITKEGTVQNVELIDGDPLLAPSAIEAVKQWIYRPTLLNGQPIEVITQVDVNYTLSQ